MRHAALAGGRSWRLGPSSDLPRIARRPVDVVFVCSPWLRSRDVGRAGVVVASAVAVVRVSTARAGRRSGHRVSCVFAAVVTVARMETENPTDGTPRRDARETHNKPKQGTGTDGKERNIPVFGLIVWHKMRDRCAVCSACAP